MSNYPAGVTGFEYQIAGPDKVYTDKRTVSCINPDCINEEVDVIVEMDMESYDSTEWGNWTCATCNEENEYEREVEEEDHSDEDYDNMRDQQRMEY
jgi:aspartate carbamoyltransferase regulatory subunit